jgi:hypothetical protein
MDASFYRGVSPVERAMLCVKSGIYGLPTTELISFLTNEIAGRSAIEVGAGHGGLAAALGIRATDNRMQEWPDIASGLLLMQQQPVIYGQNVERLDAVEAVQKYKPQVVVASWVTHKYREDRHHAEGNMHGVVEEDIIDNCETYIFIGHRHVHRNKSIWSRPHRVIEPDWLYSRSTNPSPNFIAIWGK